MEGKGKDALKSISITPQEEALLEFFRKELQYGEARVVVKNGQPVNAWQTLKNVKFD